MGPGGKCHRVCSFFNEQEHTTADTHFLLWELAQAGDYDIQIKAAGDGENFTDSEWAIHAYTAEEIVAQGFDEAGLQYDLLADGTGYEVSQGKRYFMASSSPFLNIPNTYCGLPVKRIADNAFFIKSGDIIYRDILTTQVHLPEQLEEIGKYAFPSLVYLEEIVIPDSVTTIGVFAFYECMSLRRVTLPKNLKVIPESCFRNCALTEIYFPETLEEIGDAAFLCALSLPPESHIIDGETITLGEHTFKSVTIPKSVKKIGSGAFGGCKKLEQVILEGNPEEFERAFLDTAFWDAFPDTMIILNDILLGFQGQISETSFTVPPNIKYIAGYAFASQKTLENVYIPDGVQLIGEKIFFGCTSLQSVRLPEDLKIIPGGTFLAAKNLKTITIPKSVEEIQRTAFSQCAALEEIVLPQGLKILGELAFRECTSLHSAVLPLSLLPLENTPFFGCDNLQTIYYEGDKTQWQTLIASLSENQIPIATICYYYDYLIQ